MRRSTGRSIARGMKVAAALAAAAGYFLIPSCSGRYASIYHASVDELNLRFGVGLSLIALGVVLLIGSLFLPGSDDGG